MPIGLFPLSPLELQVYTSAPPQKVMPWTYIVWIVLSFMCYNDTFGLLVANIFNKSTLSEDSQQNDLLHAFRQLIDDERLLRAALANDVTTLKREISDIKSDNAIQKEKIILLQKNVTTMEQEIDDLKRNNSYLLNQNYHLQHDISASQHNLSQLDSDIASLKSIVQLIDQDKTELKCNVTTHRTQIVLLHKTDSLLTTEINGLQKNNSFLKTELIGLQKNVMADLQTQGNMHKAIQTDISGLKQKFATLKGNYTHLVSQIQSGIFIQLFITYIIWSVWYLFYFIERTIGLMCGHSTTVEILYRPFLKPCTRTNNALGVIWMALSKPLQRRPTWLKDR